MKNWTVPTHFYSPRLLPVSGQKIVYLKKLGYGEIMRNIQNSVYNSGIQKSLIITLPCQQSLDYVDSILFTGSKATPPKKKEVSWVWHLTASDGEDPVLEL